MHRARAYKTLLPGAGDVPAFDPRQLARIAAAQCTKYLPRIVVTTGMAYPGVSLRAGISRYDHTAGNRPVAASTIECRTAQCLDG